MQGGQSTLDNNLVVSKINCIFLYEQIGYKMDLKQVTSIKASKSTTHKPITQDVSHLCGVNYKTFFRKLKESSINVHPVYGQNDRVL